MTAQGVAALAQKLTQPKSTKKPVSKKPAKKAAPKTAKKSPGKKSPKPAGGPVTPRTDRPWKQIKSQVEAGKPRKEISKSLKIREMLLDNLITTLRKGVMVEGKLIQIKRA